MIQTITPAMRQVEERPVHPDRCPPADYKPLEHQCGRFCNCDWYYDEGRDDRNDGANDDCGIDDLEDECT